MEGQYRKFIYMDQKLLAGTKMIMSSLIWCSSSLGLHHYLLTLIFLSRRRIYTYNTSFSVVVEEM